MCTCVTSLNFLSEHGQKKSRVPGEIEAYLRPQENHVHEAWRMASRAPMVPENGSTVDGEARIKPEIDLRNYVREDTTRSVSAALYRPIVFAGRESIANNSGRRRSAARYFDTWRNDVCASARVFTILDVYRYVCVGADVEEEHREREGESRKVGGG